MFTDSVAALLNRLAELEACQEKDLVFHLKRVLRAVYRISKTAEFDSILSQLSSRELNPTTRTGFATRLRKLAKYLDCAVYLFRTARELALFKRTQITCVSFDAQLFSSKLTAPTGCCLAGCLLRCQRGLPRAFRHKEIHAKLSTSSSAFESTVQGVLNESLVHAEVQIVCHYELHPVRNMPRVICSTKDACYLCNLFIQLHGKFHIPKTHGNLYRGWRLLPIPALEQAQARLNKALEAQIREEIQKVMADPNTTPKIFKNPNESTVFPFSPSLQRLSSSSVLLTEPLNVTEVEHCAEEKCAPTPRPPQQPHYQAEVAGSTSVAADVPEPAVGDQTLAATQELPSNELSDSSPGERHPTRRSSIENPTENAQSPVDQPDEQATALPEPPPAQTGDSRDSRTLPTPEYEQGPDLGPESPSPDPTPAITPPPPPLHLTPGQVLTIPLTNAKRTIPPLTTGRITIHPELGSHSTLSASATARPIVALRAQWLPAGAQHHYHHHNHHHHHH